MGINELHNSRMSPTEWLVYTIYIEVYNTETEFSLKRREGGSEAASEVEQQMMGTTASLSLGLSAPW